MFEEPSVFHLSIFGAVLLAAVTILVTGLLGVLTYLTTKALQAGYRPVGNPLLDPADWLVRLAVIGLLTGIAVAVGVPVQVLGWTGANWFWHAMAGGLIGLVLASVLALAGARLQGRARDTGFQPSEVVRLILPHGRKETVLVLLALAPAALFEEVLFRSLWIGAASLFLPLWLAVALSSLLFGLMHSAQGRAGVVATTLAGMVFGAAFVWTGSLFLPCVIHYVANVAQVLYAARLAPDMSPGTAHESGDEERSEPKGPRD